MGKLVIVGTVAFDEIETPFGKTDKILGGAATFIGLAASQFNVDAAIVSIVGDDMPEDYLNILSDKRINLDGLEIVERGKTFYWKGKYHNDLNARDTLVTELNTLADFNPVVPKNYKDADVVMLGNLHPSVQLSVINQMRIRPKLIVLDTMNFWMDNALDELLEVIKHIDVLTINDEEARQLTGEYSLVKAAHKIYGMGPNHVVIKKGVIKKGNMVLYCSMRSKYSLRRHYLWRMSLTLPVREIPLPEDSLAMWRQPGIPLLKI